MGWYHSHPHSPPTPTIRDSDLQLDYQIRMKGSSDASYTPCVGMIYSEYGMFCSCGAALSTVNAAGGFIQSVGAINSAYSMSMSRYATAG